MIRVLIPGPPRGKGRPRFARRGAFVATYTDDKTAAYENLVRMAASQSHDGEPLDGALLVHVRARMPVPSSWSKRKRAQALEWVVRPTGRPDCDNIAKAVLDGCNGVLWRDDSQIVSLTVTKAYADTPCLEVFVDVPKDRVLDDD